MTLTVECRNPPDSDRCLSTELRDQANRGEGMTEQEENHLVGFMDPAKLAKAGFYYNSKDDTVRCAFCNFVLNPSSQDSDHMAEDHKKWSEDCLFVQICDPTATDWIKSLTRQQINLRLLSYKNWPVEFMDSTKLAKAGFYYTNKDDSVRCAFCKIVLNNWRDGDDPMEDHKRSSKNCPFVQGRDCIEGRVVGNGELLHFRPMYPEYARQNQRLKSFQNYPSRIILKQEINRRILAYGNWPFQFMDPVKLAKAGFYYTNEDESVRCAHCNFVLNKWQEDGEVLVDDHKNWAKKCPFVQGLEERGVYGNKRSHRGTAYPEYPTMNERLRSFQNWPSGSAIKQEINRQTLVYLNWPVECMDRTKLAKAGFYYTKKDNHLRCASCNFIIDELQENKSLLEDHKRWSKICPFVESLDCRSISSVLDWVLITEDHKSNAKPKQKEENRI